jgi:DNA-binding transcriptional ArsR family regulator
MSSTLEVTFSALGDVTRLGIVRRLGRGPASVTELAEPLPMTLRAVLKHVQVLEDAGLVRTTKEGRVRRCELNTKAVDDAARWIEQLRQTWERRLARIDKYVTSKETR